MTPTGSRWCSMSYRSSETREERRGRHCATGLPLSQCRKRLRLSPRHLAGLQALGADAQLARPAVDDGADGLKVRQLPALRPLHDARSSAALLLGLTAAGDGGPGKRPLAADITDSRDPILLVSENGQNPKGNAAGARGAIGGCVQRCLTGPALTPGRRVPHTPRAGAGTRVTVRSPRDLCVYPSVRHGASVGTGLAVTIAAGLRHCQRPSRCGDGGISYGQAG